MLILRDRLDEARKLNDEVLKSHPDDEKSLLYSGQILIRDGHVGDAIAILQRLTKNGPSDPAGHYQLRIAFHQSGDEENAERGVEGTHLKLDSLRCV